MACLLPVSAIGALPALPLSPSHDSCDLAPYSEILEDREKEWTIEEIPFDLRMVIENVANSFAYRRCKKGWSLSPFSPPMFHLD
jgi:hypothetical protein